MHKHRAALDQIQIMGTPLPRKLRFRTINKWFAKWIGFFWVPCPICGTEFSGRECRGRGIKSWPSGTLWNAPVEPAGGQMRSGMATCPQCPGEWVVEKRRVIRDVS